MRILVFFDLPTLTMMQKRNYRQFRRFLMKNGFLMVQESVYSKLVQNSTAAETVADNVRKNKPTEGLVQLLKVTEKQYGKMEFIVGERKSEVLDTDERLVIL